MTWLEQSRKKAEKEYAEGRRVTLDDCIEVCMESIKLHSTHTKNISVNQHFREMKMADTEQLRILLELKYR